MKKLFRILFVPMLLLSALICGCKKSFEDLTQNTNVPNSVPASLLFNGVLNSMVEYPNNSKEIYDQYYIYNYDYYGNNRYDLGSGDNYYTALKNVVAMENTAASTGGGKINPYEALGKFFKAYFFTKMSLEEGDIPMTQALQGLSNLTPAYDTQKQVFQQAFSWLESANADLSVLINDPNNTDIGPGEGHLLKNDIFFANNLNKWQKTVNTFRIRLLLQLSKKTADIDVVAQFANVVRNPIKYPVMQSADDNLQFIFVAPSNYYPQTPDNFGQNGSRQNSSATYIGLLTQLQDPRVYVTAEPARYNVDTLKQSPTAFTSFIGADPGLDLGTMYNNAGLQRYSFLNRKRYYSTYTGEPSIQVGYPELMFNIAEGINRGWLTGDAESYYIKGIQSSFQFYGIPTGTGTFTAYFYRPGSTGVANLANYDTYLINVDWPSYYAQSSIKYTADANGLTKVLQQKYLALFRHSGLESYFTYRRTHVPEFTTGPGTGNGSRIALRFKYPASERTSNTDNYNKALASQYGGNDDINGVMYILK